MIRKCKQCGKKIKLSHIRVWEEDIMVSRMLTFCNIKCMIKYYKVTRYYNDTNQIADEQK